MRTEERIRYPYAYARVVGLIVETTTTTTIIAFIEEKVALSLHLSSIADLASLRLLGRPTIHANANANTAASSVSVPSLSLSLSLSSFGFSNAKLQTGPPLAQDFDSSFVYFEVADGKI